MTFWDIRAKQLLFFSCVSVTQNKDKFPVLDASWETSVPDMFYLGTAMQARDQRAASGFIHGFRYAVTSLFYILHMRYHQVRTPREVFVNSKMEDFISFVTGRL